MAVQTQNASLGATGVSTSDMVKTAATFVAIAGSLTIAQLPFAALASIAVISSLSFTAVSIYANHDDIKQLDIAYAAVLGTLLAAAKGATLSVFGLSAFAALAVSMLLFAAFIAVEFIAGAAVARLIAGVSGQNLPAISVAKNVSARLFGAAGRLH